MLIPCILFIGINSTRIYSSIKIWSFVKWWYMLMWESTLDGSSVCLMMAHVIVRKHMIYSLCVFTEGASLCPPHNGWCWPVCYSHFLSQSRSVSKHWGGSSWIPIPNSFFYLHSFYLIYGSFCLSRIFLLCDPEIRGLWCFWSVYRYLSVSLILHFKLPFCKFQSMGPWS